MICLNESASMSDDCSFPSFTAEDDHVRLHRLNHVDLVHVFQDCLFIIHFSKKKKVPLLLSTADCLWCVYECLMCVCAHVQVPVCVCVCGGLAVLQ